MAQIGAGEVRSEAGESGQARWDEPWSAMLWGLSLS